MTGRRDREGHLRGRPRPATLAPVPARGRGSRRVQPRARRSRGRRWRHRLGQRRRRDRRQASLQDGDPLEHVAVDLSTQRLALTQTGVDQAPAGRLQLGQLSREVRAQTDVMRGQLDRGLDGRTNLRVGEGSRIVRDPSHKDALALDGGRLRAGGIARGGRFDRTTVVSTQVGEPGTGIATGMSGRPTRSPAPVRGRRHGPR